MGTSGFFRPTRILRQESVIGVRDRPFSLRFKISEIFADEPYLGQIASIPILHKNIHQVEKSALLLGKFYRERQREMSQFIEITLQSLCCLKRYACCTIFRAKANILISRKPKKRPLRTMKKSITALIISLLLSLAFSQAGFAGAQGPAGSNDLTFLQKWGQSPSLSAFLLFENKDFTLFHSPLRSEHTKTYQKLTDYFSFVDAFLAAKDVFWEEIAKWNPISSFNGASLYTLTTARTRRAFDSKNLTAQDHMGICLNHGVGNKKIWNVSLDLGIALQNDYVIGPDNSISDNLFPRLGMVSGNQREDLFDQLRNASPFIGFGISCRF